MPLLPIFPPCTRLRRFFPQATPDCLARKLAPLLPPLSSLVIDHKLETAASLRLQTPSD